MNVNLIPFFLLLLIFCGCKTAKQRSERYVRSGWDLLSIDSLREKKAARAEKYFSRAISTDSNNAAAHNGKGAACFYQEKYDESLKSYDRAAHLSAFDYSIYNNRALLHRTTGNYKDAIDDYLTVQNLKPDNLVSAAGLGYCYRLTSQNDKSLRYYNKALDLKPEDYLYHGRGLTYQQKGDHENALRDFSKFISMDSTGHQIYNDRGISYYRLEKYNDAIRDYQHCIKKKADYSYAYYNLALVYRMIGKYDSAEVFHAKALELDPKNAGNSFALGYAAEKNGKREKALEYYKNAHQIDTNHLESLYNIGYVYKSSGSYDTSLMYFKKYVSRDSADAGAWNEIGLNYYYKKDNDAARIFFLKAIRVDSSYSFAYNNLGMLEGDAKNNLKALVYYRKALALNNKVPETYYNIGIQFADMYQNDSALYYYDKAILIKTDYANAYHNRGRIHFRLKDLRKALADFSRSIEIDSALNAFNSRGMIYRELGEYDKAVSDFLHCIKKKYKYPYAYNNLANTFLSMNNVKEACNYWQQALDNGYVYDPKWKAEYNIDDPVELLKKNCYK